MKKKYLTQEELQKFKLGEKLEFSTRSPFNSISVSSEKTLFFAWHWAPVSDATGTAYVCRSGDSPYKFDFDVLSFRRNEKGGAEVDHVPKNSTNYHNTNEIPQFIRDLPKNIEDRIKVYLTNKDLNKKFLLYAKTVFRKIYKAIYRQIVFSK